ncbi:nickel-binding accessory protein ureJ-hupE [Vibrio ishigakensis]|uniref:Nickel-binding accessory protein ureJ-hupE n=2 Tax=Vibrio ishigakensis TaxID=1481914 RepID=A0A0B8NH17_9VIBR|nr:HupE/UreJ family protein [Vibrio ishigakensis]GAM54065.1 nickel-binding accessory protein ureJ-hupE [Vibrio ishigakensis]GAM60889.1 nickel-binding accessory protein ureJ-hupE [Vibrio ishigakensis]
MKILAVLLMLASAPAYAHIRIMDAGFFEGILHPVVGVDHLMAMLSVGIVSARLGGKYVWTIPACFMLAMVCGAGFALNGVRLILSEFAIALSVLVLGIAIFTSYRPAIIIGIIGTGFFGIFHGYAHGSELPRLANPELFASGFLVGTALIHLAGVMLGKLAERREQFTQYLNYAGAAFAGIGGYLVTEYLPLLMLTYR